MPETLGGIFTFITLNPYALQRLLIIALSVLAFQPSPNFPDFSNVITYISGRSPPGVSVFSPNSIAFILSLT